MPDSFIDNDDFKPDNIIGKWQLEKEIENPSKITKITKLN